MSLVVWLPLNGNLENQGLSNVTVTNNGATVNNSGKIGNCFNFDGINDYITITNPLTNNNKEFSLCAWVYCIDRLITLFCARTQGEKGIYFSAQNSGSHCIFDDGVRWDTGYYIPLNTWIHVCVTRTQSKKCLYINGQLQASTTTVGDLSQIGSIGFMGNNATNTTLGSVWSNGKVNDFRIYDHALSAKEVKELAKGLVLHYRLAGPGQANLLNGNIHLASAWNQENHTVVNYSDSNFTGLKITATRANGRIYNSVSNLWVTNNAKYTVSFWAKSDTAGTTIDCSRSITDFSPTFTLDTNWKYYSGIITTTETSAGGTLSIRINQASRVVYIANIKVENGAIATPFVPPSNSSIYSAMGYNNNIEYDCAGYQRNGTKSGNITWDADTPRYITSYKFDGSTAGIEVTAAGLGNIMNNPCTIAFWLYSNDKGGRSIYFSAYNSKNISWSIEKTNDERFRYYWNGSLDRYSTGVTIPDKKWTHICFVREGISLAKLYLDGNLKYSFTDTTSSLSLGDTWRIGRDVRTGDGTPLNGNMSDFRIYATALSAEDIAELYHTSAMVDNQNNLYAYEYVEEEAHA